MEQVLRALPAPGLSVLVNNVGVSYDYPMFYDELSDASVEALTRLNCDSTAHMTHIALRVMKEKERGAGGAERRGAVMSVASAAGAFVSPLLSEYSAAKAYVVRLSQCLAVEYGSKGFDIQATTPAFITTKLAKIRKASLTVPTPESFAKSLCDRFGYETVTNPNPFHAIMVGFLQRIPFGSSIVMSNHLGIRSKALKKKAAAASGGKSE